MQFFLEIKWQLLLKQCYPKRAKIYVDIINISYSDLKVARRIFSSLTRDKTHAPCNGSTES